MLKDLLGGVFFLETLQLERKIRIMNQYLTQPGCFKEQFRGCDGLFLYPLNKILFILNCWVCFVFWVPDFVCEMGKFSCSQWFFPSPHIVFGYATSLK